MPWQELPVSQYRALLKKSLATRQSRILDLAAEVGPVIEKYRAQGHGFRRIAVLLPLADLHPQAADDRYELRYRVYAYELTRRTHYGNALYEAFRSRPAIRPDPAVPRRRQGRTLSEEPTP